MAKRHLDTIRDVLENQITCNRAISDTGLAGHYGAEVGATLRGMFQEGPFEMRAAAAAAAGSDARMNGCPPAGGHQLGQWQPGAYHHHAGAALRRGKPGTTTACCGPWPSPT